MTLASSEPGDGGDDVTRREAYAPDGAGAATGTVMTTGPPDGPLGRGGPGGRKADRENDGRGGRASTRGPAHRPAHEPDNTSSLALPGPVVEIRGHEQQDPERDDAADAVDPIEFRHVDEE